MTTLLIQTETMPLTVNLPAIAPMTPAQFYKFCLANRNLCIERTASGDVIIKVRQLDGLRGLDPRLLIKTQPSSLPQ
jgi:hypothetical protein